MEYEKKLHENFSDLLNDLQLNYENMFRRYTLQTNRFNYKLSFLDIKNLIIQTCDIIYLPNEMNDIDDKDYAIYDPRKKAYVNNLNFLQKLCIEIIDMNNSRYQSYLVLKEVNTLIKKSDNIRKANLPPNYILKFNNCIYDIKNKEIHNGLDNQNNEYDFINTIEFDLKPLENNDPQLLDITKEVFRLWSGNNNDNLKFIKQITMAAIEGNGRKRYIILKSEGGDGKSTFQYILKKLVGLKNTRYINLHQFDDDNSINQILTSTKLIIGDDLQNKYKVSNKAMTNFKSLVSGDILNVSEKFMPNKNISTNAVMIQNTNTDVNFYENTPAIQDRLLVFKWPHYNFRDNPITEFNLDDLLGKNDNTSINTDFIEAVLSYIIHTTEYFNKFSITEEMQNNTNEMLSNNDTISMFINDLKENDILEYSHLPNKLIYEYYKEWLKTNNPGSKPMKAREFGQRFNKKMFELNYKIVKQKRINSIKRYEFNSKLLMSNNDLNEKSYNKSNYYNVAQSKERSNVLINEDLFFNDNDIGEITDILINTENFNQLKDYTLPVIQYCIENLCQNKLSLIANLESVDKMYTYTKDELIEKLNM